MNILVLCKRQYSARDLLSDQYGRLYEIPEGLARLGHRVHGLASSYRPRPHLERHVSPAGVVWRSANAMPWGPFHARRAVAGVIADCQPDILWASSDALHAIWAVEIGRTLHIPVVIDLYDNYEHFGLSRLPGISRRYRDACRSASGLTIVSHSLARHVQQHYPASGPCAIVGNGVNSAVFHARDRSDCRRALGLPAGATIIGCAGAIQADRGIEDLFEAFQLLAEADPALHLAFAGPRDGTPSRYRHPRIIDLGILDWREVPLLVNALDVAVICNRDSSFGRYCFPLKLSEALACGVPVVAAGVGDVNEILGAPSQRYRPGDAHDLAQKLQQQLSAPANGQAASTAARDWKALAGDTADLLAMCLQRRPR